MTLTVQHKGLIFGVGDKVRVIQKIGKTGTSRLQSFEGTVIAIKGEGENKTFTVRRISVGHVGVERIFPLFSPTLEKIEVVRTGTPGVKHAKLYYIRGRSKKEAEKIYSRTAHKSPSKKTSE